MSAKSCRKIEVLNATDKILAVMQDYKEPLSIADIAKLSGLSTDVVFRQTGTLEELNWLSKIGEGYILGQRLSVIWAKRKALVEDRIEKSKKELEELMGGIDGE